MAANAIYFPYINVPPDPWLLRMLLYWDRLNAIVPFEYHYEPERLEPKMRDMVRAGLVQPIAPGMYLGGANGFADPFLRYVERWKRAYRNRGELPQTRIHAEKLYGLTQPLVEMGVAREIDGCWYSMPTPIANRFMAHLASALGQIDEIDAAPVTNRASLGQSLQATGLIARRDALLELLFPMPSRSENLTLDDIVDFKVRHQPMAARFRERVQEECTLLTYGATDEERQDQMQMLGRRLQGEVDEITEAMRGRWKKIVLGQILPVLAPAIPLIDANPTQVATHIGAVVAGGLAAYQAGQMKAADRAVRRRPLAYVALAQDRLPALRPRSHTKYEPNA